MVVVVLVVVVVVVIVLSFGDGFFKVKPSKRVSRWFQPPSLKNMRNSNLIISSRRIAVKTTKTYWRNHHRDFLLDTHMI